MMDGITANCLLFSGFLFVGIIICIQIGYYFGKKHISDCKGSRDGLGIIEGSVFALLGLLIAFSLSDSLGRYVVRKNQIVEEATHVGTAYLRIDLLPAVDQEPMRELFRKYLDSRLLIYKKLPDIEAAKKELIRSQQIQNEIWKKALQSVEKPGTASSVSIVFLPALNAMFDITIVRTMASRIHTPIVIYGMLGLVALAAALLAGHSMAESHKKSWLHIFGFAVVVVLTVYVILDLEYPRMGLFGISDADIALVEVRESMK